LLSPEPSNAGGDDAVFVYEDEHSSEDEVHAQLASETQTTYQPSQPRPSGTQQEKPSQSRSVPEPEEFSDRDEENDPIIGSFGPAGHNLLPRMASITAGASPSRAAISAAPLKESVSPKQPTAKRAASESTDATGSTLANHIINQLAFSRLSSTPLSTIMNHLPAEFKGDTSGRGENRPLDAEELKKVLEGTVCIGVVDRQGKDAAGKRLESEYYYVPDLDQDERRREAVTVGVRKPGLRNCRKQHKVRRLA
jgi:regulator of nonsense transcripts 2